MERISFIFISIILTLTSAFSVCNAGTVAELYEVGAGDVLDVKVLENPDFSGHVTVALDGNINMPYVGNVRVSGENLEEIADIITKKLSEGYIKFPAVSVSLAQSSSKKIYGYGHLKMIGQIPYQEHITVIKALSIFSGMSEQGMFGKFILKRKKAGKYKNIVEVNVDNGVLVDSAVEEIVLEPDDILYVERSDTILLQGEVMKRGRVALENNMTVLSALLQIGGVSSNGLYGIIKIRRKQNGSEDYKDIARAKLDNGVITSNEVEETILMPDDILIVEQSETILLQGKIAKRGLLVLEKDMTVVTALLQAGGVSEDGSYGVLKIRRKEEGSQEYKDIAEAKLNDGAIESNEVAVMILQPDDILVVERSKKYFIYGEVNRTGEFVLTKDMTVFKALTIAGGFTKWGSANRVKVLRSNQENGGFETIHMDVDDVIEGDATKDIILIEGDIVVVSTGMF